MRAEKEAEQMVDYLASASGAILKFALYTAREGVTKTYRRAINLKTIAKSKAVKRK
jgi:hypothetical protein